MPFRHVPEASPEAPARTGDFSIHVTSGATLGPLTRNGWRRTVADVVLVVYYEDRRDAAGLRDRMVADYEALSARLLSSALWEPQNADIESVAMLGGDVVLSYNIEAVEGGALLLVEFPVTYRER